MALKIIIGGKIAIKNVENRHSFRPLSHGERAGVRVFNVCQPLTPTLSPWEREKKKSPSVEGLFRIF
jgi:hypothetical protein